MSQPHAQWVSSQAADDSLPPPLQEQSLPLVPARAKAAAVTAGPATLPLGGAVAQAVDRRDWWTLAPRLTAAILALLGLAELGHISWDLLHMPKAPAAAPALAFRPLARPMHGLRLSSAHLFGMQPSAAEQAAVVERARPINWMLTGVIASRDPLQGVAIVGEAGRIEVLRAGDPIAAMPGARLAQIFNDHVVIDRQGQMQTVELPRQSASRAPPPVAAPVPEPEQPMQPVTRRGMRPAAVAESLLAGLNPEPHTDASGRISWTVRPTALMQRQYGIRDGDTLTQINGQPLNEPETVANAMRGAAAGETVTITFTHAGVEQTVTLPAPN